jgi:ABC-type transport system substrate-binding protein
VAARLTSAVIAVAAAAATAWAETRPDYGGELVGALASEPASLDPVRAASHAEVTLAGLVFDTLYRTGDDGAVVPHLAAALPEADGGTLRIRLRRGVTFHDGRAVDAADVQASLRRLLKSGARWLLAPIDVIDVEAGDLVLSVQGDAAGVAALLAAPQAAITPRGKAPTAKAMIGSGPFRVDTIDRARRRIALIASDDHFAGRPYVDRLELRWFDTDKGQARQFEDGKLHLSARGATEFDGARPKYRAGVVEGPATILTYVGFGRAHKAVTFDPDFRRAVHLAIARRGLAVSGSGEWVTPTADPLPEGLGGQALPKNLLSGDRKAAAEALATAAARVPALGDKQRAELSLVILVDRSRLDDLEVARRVVFALKKLDLAATIEEVDAAQLSERVDRGEGELWIGQLAAAGAAPELLWGAAFEAGGDDWVRRQLAAGTFDAGKARQQFTDRLPIVPLLHRGIKLHHRSDVRGIGFDAATGVRWADLFFHGEPVKTKRKAR